MSGQRVHITEHALTRGRQRFSPPLLPSVIRREVAAALDEGRVAKRVPAWAHQGERYRQKQKQTAIRHAWPPCESRCYIVERRARGVAVVTVLAPPLDVATNAA